MVGVVEEEHKVTEADQGVRAGADSGQVTGVSMDVADDVDPRPGGAVSCACHGDQE
ncbi:hypothetical protein GCM10010094_16580 [Streptomyces flaveus]|uniref:Uncharacterized protein n=1 Tax=Streptomyces flaveus TaxID=66370 RepID=A0A917VAX4_9ACTN|nr:hypothetical protein GCM10010094_16580 [Streptomyces flaveus]